MLWRFRLLRMFFARFVFILATAGLTACTAAPQSTGDGEPRAAEGFCADPRPEICTMDYTPVCGQLRDGTEKTYSNGCSACSDIAVESYRPGACEEQQ